MNIEEVIGTNLRRVREGRGQSQTEFGAALGEVLGSTWKPQTVSAAEKGRRQFVAADLVALAHALGVSVPTLLTPPSDVTTVTAGTVEVPASALTLLPFSDGETVDPRFLEWSFRGVAMGRKWIDEATKDARAALDRVDSATEFQRGRIEAVERALRGEALPESVTGGGEPEWATEDNAADDDGEG